MINLGGAVRGRQGHIMKTVIGSGGKKEPRRHLDKGFPEHPFEAGGAQEEAQKAEEQHGGDEPPKCFQGVYNDR